MKHLTPSPLSGSLLAPFGQVILPADEEDPFGSSDADLCLDQGKIRFWVMKLPYRNPEVSKLTRHSRCSQCLASADAKPWWMLMAPPNAGQAHPEETAIRLFRIDPGLALKLHVGTWHGGPYFQEPTARFFNLELADTNINDHTSAPLQEPITFAMASV